MHGLFEGFGASTTTLRLPAVRFYLQEGRPYALVAAEAGLSSLPLVRFLPTRRG
ncbi:hypothetical protein OG389_03440 [Streptomyces sp. NBC_00435]|uniref:hypothetical protein n=1 Tax=Streptomyces sp. NBC_00435 TaxID=2903649 RepID=UPI002E1BE7CA